MNTRTRSHFAARAAAAAFVAAAAWPAPPARADGTVDLELRSGDRVSGTLRPASQVELFRGSVPRGAQLAASLKSKRKTQSPLALELRQDGMSVPGAVTSVKGAAVALAPFSVPGSGTYELVVVGNGTDDTDYDFNLSWKPQTKSSVTGASVAPAATDSFTFSAPAGATATIDVVPAKGSAFVTGFIGVTGPAAYDLPGGAGTRVVAGPLPATGDYAVSFRNDGASAGAWTAKLKLKLAKGAKAKIDIRDGSTTGAFGGDHTAFGRVLGPDGGTVDAPPSAFGPLQGTSVTIPAGALGAATTITVSAAPPISPGGGVFGAGPAVEFGPEGTVFDPTGGDPSKQATITIPFDPNYFPNGTDSLRIYVRTADGTTTEVPPPYVFNGNTVSFTTSHFSTYQATGSGQEPLVGNYLMIELLGDAQPNFSGVMGFGLHSFYASGTTASLNNDEARVAWDDVPGQGASANLRQDYNYTPYDLNLLGGRRVAVVDPQSPTSPVAYLQRSPSSSVLVGDGIPVVALRYAAAEPTMTTIAGRWHVFHLGVEADTQTFQMPTTVRLGLVSDAGTITLAPDGSTSFSNFESIEADTVFPSGAWQFQKDKPPPGALTWSVQDNDTVFVAIVNPEDGETIALTPVLDGDVLVGRPFSYGGQTNGGPYSDLFVLVRASSGASLAGVAGNFIVAGQDVETVDRTPNPGQGLEFAYPTVFASISKTGALSGTGEEDRISHDSQGNPVTATDLQVPQFTDRISLRSDGWFTVSDGAVGAFSRSRELFVRARFDGTAFALAFGGPFPVVTGK